MYTNLENFLANLSFLTLFIAMISYWSGFFFDLQIPFGFGLSSLDPWRVQNSLAALDKVGPSQTQSTTVRSNPRPEDEVTQKGNFESKPLPIFFPKGEVYISSPTVPYTLNPQKSVLRAPLTLDSSFFINKVKLKPRLFLMGIANLSIFCLLVFRWVESGHFPLSNLYESLMFLSWSTTLIHILFSLFIRGADSRSISDPSTPILATRDTQYLDSSRIAPLGKVHSTNLTVGAVLETCLVGATQPQGEGGSPKIATFDLMLLLGSITAPLALFTNAFATLSLPKEMQNTSALVPALQSNWLMMHVTVMIISYATLIIGSLLAIAFLVITNNKRSDFSNSLAKTLDNLSYRILGLGFPFLTIGILSGAVWANEAWGSYWSWDPKETWAFLTWLVFAIYLHTRITKGWNGRKPAIIASLGFITVWVCYLGVNLLGEGLHSYGFFSHSI